MTKKELNDKLQQLQSKYDWDRHQAIKQYCYANNPYKVGDVFTDHIGSVLVDSISLHKTGGDYGEYGCKYNGIILNKDLTPNKLGKTRTAYQCNELTADKIK